MNLRKLAKGKPCMVRLPGVCLGRGDTVVLAHVRLAGVTGGSQKAPDALGAWCCYECHQVSEAEKADDWIQRAFLEGVVRTQYALIRDGVIRW